MGEYYLKENYTPILSLDIKNTVYAFAKTLKQQHTPPDFTESNFIKSKKSWTH